MRKNLKFYKYIIDGKIVAILAGLQETGRYKILKEYVDVNYLDYGYIVYYDRNTKTLFSLGTNRIQPLNIEDITPEMKLDLL